jgi:inhibitor of KinA sporulation pathway (predicted exonuclease)
MILARELLQRQEFAELRGASGFFTAIEKSAFDRYRSYANTSEIFLTTYWNDIMRAKISYTEAREGRELLSEHFEEFTTVIKADPHPEAGTKLIWTGTGRIINSQQLNEPTVTEDRDVKAVTIRRESREIFGARLIRFLNAVLAHINRVWHGELDSSLDIHE